jgi:hypothetical protein
MTDQATLPGPAAVPVLPHIEMTVELVIDSYRVTGEIRSQGGPRRLVDILNTGEMPFVVVYDGELDDPRIDDEPRRFGLIQVHLETILFAIPRSDSGVHPDPYEIVAKVPVPSTVTVPGYELSGNIYLLPEMDPAGTHLLGGRHFVPMTDVTIHANGDCDATWSEEIVVLNLARTRLFAPGLAQKSSRSASPSGSQRATPPNRVRRNSSP